jgi:hypothetical protein
LAVGFGSKTYETLLARDAELREEHRELLDIEFVGINPNDTSFGVMDRYVILLSCHLLDAIES